LSAARAQRLERTAAAWALGLAALCAVQGGACRSLNMQRWPGPMEDEVRPLPPGDAELHPPGTEEVTVVRHADPVRVREPGVTNARHLPFYEKQVRLSAGCQVLVAAGGRAELLFTEGSSILFYGGAVAWIGSPSRGEPICDLRAVENARVMLAEGDQLRLVGGALLSGAGGPYLLSASVAGTLAVHNQSKGSVEVAFREETFELSPGQQVLLPLLSSGGAPFAAAEGLQRIGAPGFNVDVQGPLEAIEREQGLALRATGAGEALGLGVRVRLAPGAEATFGGLAPTGQGGARLLDSPAEGRLEEPPPAPAAPPEAAPAETEDGAEPPPAEPPGR
jgi:hypothetical protein